MKLSVLISLYDKETPDNYYQSLLSISRQTYPASEVVIVYDGPINNNLHEITMLFSEKLNIKIERLPYNQGLGKALNYGLTKCSNELVARMDTDDICLEDRFQKQIDFFSKNTDTDILGGAIIEFDNDKFERIKRTPCEEKEIFDYTLLKNPINHMAVMFKKSRIQSCGGYIHHLYMEDYNLWIRAIYYRLSIRNLPDVLVRARVGSVMLKRRKGIKYIKSEFELLKLKRKFLEISLKKSIVIFLLRTTTRLLPSIVLSFIYRLDRDYKL